MRSSAASVSVQTVPAVLRHARSTPSSSHNLNASNPCRVCACADRLGLSEPEQRVLMRAFDQDMNGTVNYEEFLRGVRGRLNGIRKKMVRQIFDALDKIGGDLGYLTVA